MGDWKTWGRPTGNVGQIGILRTHGFSSWLIRTITRSHTNHVVIDVGDGLVSAEYPHVIKRDYQHFSNEVWSQFEYTDGQRAKIVEFANTQLGKPYGWADDLGTAAGLVDSFV
jgi:hypothetical protein